MCLYVCGAVAATAPSSAPSSAGPVSRGKSIFQLVSSSASWDSASQPSLPIQSQAVGPGPSAGQDSGAAAGEDRELSCMRGGLTLDMCVRTGLSFVEVEEESVDGSPSKAIAEDDDAKVLRPLPCTGGYQMVKIILMAT